MAIKLSVGGCLSLWGLLLVLVASICVGTTGASTVASLSSTGASVTSGSLVTSLGWLSSFSGGSLGSSGTSISSCGGGVGLVLVTAPFILGRLVTSMLAGAWPAGSAQALYGFSLLSC